MARVGRSVLLGLSLGLALLSLGKHLEWDLARQRTMDLLRDVQLPARQARGSMAVRRNDDPARARLHIARMLLAEAFDPDAFAALTPGGAREAYQLLRVRLETAKSLAAAVLVERPAAWEAAMILGAATYWTWARSDDPRLWTEAPAWRSPMRAAMELAPGKAEPVRVLAAIELELWASLSETERAAAKDHLRRAMDRPSHFARLLEIWLVVAGREDELFSVLPDRVWAWSELQDAFVRRKDWEPAARARRRVQATLERELKARLLEAEERARLGDVAGARSELMAIAAECPTDLRFAPILARALERCPAGPVSRHLSPDHRRLLDWVLERSLYQDCPLPAPALKRLAQASGEIPPETAAMAALASGDLALASRLERCSELAWSEEWSDFQLLKARAELASGQAEAAIQRLDRMHRSRRDGVLASELRRQASEVLEGTAAAQASPEAPAAGPWPATAWRWSRGMAKLDLPPTAEARGLEVEVSESPADGALVELQWDGKVAAILPARPKAKLRFAVEAGPGVHSLGLISVAGGDVAPGTVKLWAPES